MLLKRLFAGVPVLSPAVLPEVEITSVEYDSRRAGEGSLFCCLIGAKTDGHRYAASAYEKGCRAFLVSRPAGLPIDAVQILVADTRSAMASVCWHFYGDPAETLKLIGVTGTKGKTTTALLIDAILNAAGRKCGYIGSNGVRIAGKEFRLDRTTPTTPEARELAVCFDAMVRAGCSYCVMEVSSQALKMHRVAGLRFRAAAFTNLSPAHIGEGEHPDFADYKACKTRLFTEYSAEVIAANADDPAWREITGGKPAFTCSLTDPAADFTARDLVNLRTETTLGVSFECRTPVGITHVRLRSPGSFSVRNALLAMAVCAAEGVSPDAMAATLATVYPEGRFEIVEGIPGRTFVIDYAHNGASLSAALGVLREYRPERLICLFGTVGGRTQIRRRELAEAASAADFCILTTDNPDFEDPDAIIDDIAAYMTVPYVRITDREQAIRTAVRDSREGDVILFAGKGHEKYQFVRGKEVPFCEADIIRDECAKVMDERNESKKPE